MKLIMKLIMKPVAASPSQSDTCGEDPQVDGLVEEDDVEGLAEGTGILSDICVTNILGLLACLSCVQHCTHLPYIILAEYGLSQHSVIFL